MNFTVKKADGTSYPVKIHLDIPDGHLKIPHLWSARNPLFNHPECHLITVHRQGLFFLEFLTETQKPLPLRLWLSMEEYKLAYF
jgi:hypothetical protein